MTAYGQRAAGRLTATYAAMLVVGFLASCLVAPSTASAAFIWSEGGSKQFGGTVGTGLVKRTVAGKYAIELSVAKVWEFKGSGPAFDPRSAQRLASGNTVVADATGTVVTEYSPTGSRVWWYSDSLVLPYFAQRLSNGNTLITDRGSGSVIEVNSTKQIVWRYGDGTPGLEPGRLVDPVYAERISGGNTLIVDASGGHRVIEVRSSDYDPSEPADGYSPSSIVWRHDASLVLPFSAQRLSNGNTLIADSGGHRVIEVDSPGSIKWQFGMAGESGTSLSQLHSPVSARRQADGTTLIVDRDNNRVLSVDSQRKAELVRTGSLSSPQTALITPTGTTLIADQGSQRLIEFGHGKSANSGKSGTGLYSTKTLDLGTPGVRKQITRIEAVADRPASTAVRLQYSLNGGAWKSVSGSKVTFSAGKNATSVRVRAELSTTNRNVTPQLNSVQVTYNLIPTTTASTGTNTASLYATPLTVGPLVPPSSTGPTASSKVTGAAGALPQGAATAGIAQATVYSGFLMQRVTNSAATTEDTQGLSGLPVEAAGTAAALLLLTAVYSLGLASTTLSQATQGAASALKSVLTRSM